LEEGAPGTPAERSLRSAWDVWRQFTPGAAPRASSGSDS
jgi:hypothetical protein